MTTQVQSQGGNEYKVTINGITELVDLDGFTIMSDDEYNRILEAERETGVVLMQDEMECPTSAREAGTWSEHELAALDEVANYSGFDAQDYVEACKE